MQSYLFVGGNWDGLDVPAPPDQDTIQLPAGVTGKETYIRDELAVSDRSVTVYRHNSLTSAQVLDWFVVSCKAWAVNRPGASTRL